MPTESGAGEGQTLAHRILAALDADRAPDWDGFHTEYGRWLVYVASRCLARHSVLGSGFESPEELVNAFLAEKVLPPRKARLMFGGPARGERPLRPRLATSLRNFYMDVLRSCAAARIRGWTDSLEMVETREQLPLPDYDDVAGAICRQLRAIRGCLPLHQGAPYRLALLMRHRTDWAAVFDGVHLPKADGGESIELTLPILEGLTPWDNSELRTRLGESPVSLGSFWESVRPRLIAAPDRRLSSADMAAMLRVPRDLWDQWVSRGRRRLRQHFAIEYSELFALWAT